MHASESASFRCTKSSIICSSFIFCKTIVSHSMSAFNLNLHQFKIFFFFHNSFFFHGWCSHHSSFPSFLKESKKKTKQPFFFLLDGSGLASGSFAMHCCVVSVILLRFVTRSHSYKIISFVLQKNYSTTLECTQTHLKLKIELISELNK